MFHYNFRFFLFVYNGVLMERRRVVVVYIDVEPISSHILFITFYMFFFLF